MTLPVSAAAVHHALLGGQAGLVRDRTVADAVTAAAPWWPRAAMLAHRQGMRMVAHLASRGCHQFLDLGSGHPSPTRRQVHQTAVAFCRSPRRVRTVYVDHDVHAYIAQGAAALHQDDAIAVLGDITATETLLGHLPARTLLDFDRPVAVLLHDVLPWLPDEAAVHLMTELRRRLPRGSVISLTHLLPSSRPYATTPLVRCYREAGIRLRPRELPSITALSGTWPTHTNGPHTGAGPLPVCSVLLGSPGPRFPRPSHWAPVSRGTARRTPAPRMASSSGEGAHADAH